MVAAFADDNSPGGDDDSCCLGSSSSCSITDRSGGRIASAEYSHGPWSKVLGVRFELRMGPELRDLKRLND